MILPSTKDIILALKDAKAKRNLSVPCIQKMCADAGHYMAINTFRNIFARDSEDRSFNYNTLKSIADVLIPREEPANDYTMRDLELLTKQLAYEREEHRRQTESLNQRIKEYKVIVARQDEFIKELLEKKVKE